MPGTLLFGIDVETANENAEQFVERASKLFHSLEAPVTWYITGRTLEQYPNLFRAFEDDPFIDLQAHTYSHLLLKTVLIHNRPKAIHGDGRCLACRKGAGCAFMDDIEARIKVLVGDVCQDGHDKDSIIGKTFFIEGPSFEGFAEVLGVNDDDTVNIRSSYSGKIYIVEKDDLSYEEAEEQEKW